MSKEVLTERRKTLEESFFAAHNERLKRRFQERNALQEKKQALADASGISDSSLLDKLLEQNITSESLAALSLVPLVEVAWADGTMEAKERKIILESIVSTGIRKESASFEIIKPWLEQKPNPELKTTWKEYTQALCKILGPQEADKLKNEVLGRAKAVAKASGGLLDFIGTVSSDEKNVILDMEQAFEAKN